MDGDDQRIALNIWATGQPNTFGNFSQFLDGLDLFQAPMIEQDLSDQLQGRASRLTAPASSFQLYS